MCSWAEKCLMTPPKISCLSLSQPWVLDVHLRPYMDAWLFHLTVHTHTHYTHLFFSLFVFLRLLYLFYCFFAFIFSFFLLFSPSFPSLLLLHLYLLPLHHFLSFLLLFCSPRYCCHSYFLHFYSRSNSWVSCSSFLLLFLFLAFIFLFFMFLSLYLGSSPRRFLPSLHSSFFYHSSFIYSADTFDPSSFTWPV